MKIKKLLVDLSDIEIRQLTAKIFVDNITRKLSNMDEVSFQMLDEHGDTYGHFITWNPLESWEDTGLLIDNFDISISFRYDRYYHTQCGPEKPSNFTLQTDDNLKKSICLSVLSKVYGIVEFHPHEEYEYVHEIEFGL